MQTMIVGIVNENTHIGFNACSISFFLHPETTFKYRWMEIHKVQQEADMKPNMIKEARNLAKGLYDLKTIPSSPQNKSPFQLPINEIKADTAYSKHNQTSHTNKQTTTYK